MPTKKIYTVTELNNRAKNILEEKFPSLWVQGEISRITLHSSGHMYFTLKDSSCAIDSVMFRSSNIKLGFRPEQGLEVLVRGRLSLFAAQGRYQLIVDEMKKKGAGELEDKFRKLKEKLFKEGLFDEEHKKKIPAVPRLIGIVTSPTGAAVRDILNVIKRRFANVDIIIFPARVQGELASGEIVKGIETLNDKYPEMDAMIVGRGGGSIEDLWPFNEEIVARAVFNSKIPIISAVGHEIDFTICDFAADMRAPTPSAAAELVVQNKEDLLQRISRLHRSMIDSVRGKIRIVNSACRSAFASAVLTRPFRIIEDREQQADYLAEKLETVLRHSMEIRNHTLNALKGSIDSLSPRRTLERGYSITYLIPGKTPVKYASSARQGDRIKTILATGVLSSEITEIEKEK